MAAIDDEAYFLIASDESEPRIILQIDFLIAYF